MQKIYLGFLTLSTLFFASCSNELDELTTNDSTIKLDNSTNIVQSGMTNFQNAKAIPNTYIVVFKENLVSDVELESDKINREHGGNKLFTYTQAIKGFAISNLSDKAIEAIKRNPKVSYVEQDQEVFAIGTQTSVLSWGIDRIDQTSLPLSSTYTYPNTGAGVKAYIIDTGIKLDHKDFGGRAIKGIDVINKTFIDGNGHGTHVSGTVGGSTYGVAKGITLVAVRVLNNQGSGTTSGVIAGVDWVTKDHTNGLAVANMSLGGGISTTLDAAVKKAIADGVVFCVAAGNSTADASTSSPARVAEAITVAASDRNDAFAYYSNFGTLVDIIAPGSAITSDWSTSTTATNTISGTSMATPHVTGAAALYLVKNPSATPVAVQSALKTAAISGKISAVPAGTTNALLQVIQ